MGADDSTAVNQDHYESGKVVDAVIEGQQAPCAAIDFSIYFSAQIHAMSVNRLYALARSLCRDLPADCRVRRELVAMLALHIGPLPEPSVEAEAAQTICDIISEMFMPFVEGGIACLLVCDPGRGEAAQGAYYISLPASCFLVLHCNVCCCVAVRLAQG